MPMTHSVVQCRLPSPSVENTCRNFGITNANTSSSTRIATTRIATG